MYTMGHALHLMGWKPCPWITQMNSKTQYSQRKYINPTTSVQMLSFNPERCAPQARFPQPFSKTKETPSRCTDICMCVHIRAYVRMNVCNPRHTTVYCFMRYERRVLFQTGVQRQQLIRIGMTRSVLWDPALSVCLPSSRVQQELWTPEAGVEFSAHQNWHAFPLSGYG